MVTSCFDVVHFSPPFFSLATYQGPITNGFDWSSDSNEALDRTLSWPLSSYATMDAIEMQFPVGDTYKFDLQLFDDSDDPVQDFPVGTHLQ